MSDRFDAYKAAVKEHKGLEQKLKATMSVLAHVSKVLEANPASLRFTATSTDMAATTNEPVDSTHWLSAQQLMDLVTRWQETKQHIIELFDALHSDERDLIQPPAWMNVRRF